MNRIPLFLLATAAAASLTACAGSSGVGVGLGYNSNAYDSGPYSYDGYYDDYYGPIYDGYWGSDNNFYYRNNGEEREYHRGDGEHFNHEQRQQGNFHQFHTQTNPGRDMNMPNFNRGDRGRGNGGGHHDGGDRGNGRDHHDGGH